MENSGNETQQETSAALENVELNEQISPEPVLSESNAPVSELDSINEESDPSWWRNRRATARTAAEQRLIVHFKAFLITHIAIVSITFAFLNPSTCDVPFLYGYLIISLFLSILLCPQRLLRLWLEHHRPNYVTSNWFQTLMGIAHLADVLSVTWSMLFATNLFKSKCERANPQAFWTVAFEIFYRVFYFVLTFCLTLYVKNRYPEENHHGSGLDSVNYGLTPNELSQLKLYKFSMKQGKRSVEESSEQIKLTTLSNANVGRANSVRTLGSLKSINYIKNSSLGLPNTSLTSLVPSSVTGVHYSSEFSCAICVSDYVDGEWIRELSCKHLFHKECIDIWLCGDEDGGYGGHRTCPLCNSEAVAAETV
ncbi:hypothetical protein HK098_003669 [Nowakowskiella sp. JEL0407]|nr:hypothetical protein HK098_003669 [Nowakowskiella sp. JEL0407]